MTVRCSPPLRQTVIYFVLIDHGPEIGLAWAERDPARMSRAQTLADHQSGQFDTVIDNKGYGIRQVLEVEFTDAGISSRDVTEDFVLARARHQQEEPPLSPEMRRWLQIDHERDLRKHEVAS